MYRIYYMPSGKLIASETKWRDAADAMTTHAAEHQHYQVFNTLVADPSVILHLASMGDDTYRIDRDELDAFACSHCDTMGAVTSTGSVIGYGGWVIACCPDCAADNAVADETDYTPDQLRAAIDRALAPPISVTADRGHGTVTIKLTTTQAHHIELAVDVISQDTDADRVHIAMTCDQLRRALTSAIEVSAPSVYDAAPPTREAIRDFVQREFPQLS
jgi:hypothetical protein